MQARFELIAKDNMEIILPILQKAAPHLSRETLQNRLRKMVDNGYECVGIYTANELIGISGIWTLVKYYVGKHIEADNVYILEEYRNLGLGAKLNIWLQNLATERGCDALEINCYIENTKGKAFWEANGYQTIGIHYQKLLK